jgi:hypothetical protein
MAAKHKDRCKFKSLNGQIFAAEQQLLHSRRGVAKSGSRLLGRLQQRMTEPATLLLAGGLGFMFAELTKLQPTNTCKKNARPSLVANTALNIAQGFIIFIHELYTTLPLILIAKSYFDSKKFSGAPESRSGTAAGIIGVEPIYSGPRT